MDTEKFQPAVTASAFVDEHPPTMCCEVKGLMGFHGRLVPGWSGSFMLTLAAISPRKERWEEKTEFPSDMFSIFYFFLSFPAQNVNLRFEDNSSVTELHRSRQNAEIISASGNYIYLFSPPPCSCTVTVQTDKSKHEKDSHTARFSFGITNLFGRDLDLGLFV